MTSQLEYRGYIGSAEYSAEDEVFYGKLEYIRDLVSYEADDARGLRRAFEEAVDDYLETCAAENRRPNEPFKGSFNVRAGPDLHRQAVLAARKQGVNLNTFVGDALRAYLRRDDGASR